MITIKKDNIKLVSSGVLIIIYIFFVLRIQLNEGISSLYIVLGTGLLALLITIKNNMKFSIYFIFVSFLAFFLLMLKGSSTSIAEVYLPLLLSNLGITLALLKYKPHPFFGYLIYYFCAVYLLLYWNEFNTFKFIFQNSSANNVSVIMIFISALYYIIIHKNNLTRNELKLYDLLPAILTLIISILAEGRSGVISSILLFAFVLFIYVKNKTFLIKSFYSVVSFLIILFIYYFNMKLPLNELYAETFRKFHNKGLDGDGRGEILKLYIQNTTVPTFFLGDSWDATYKYFYNGNLHNSFLRGHLYFGFIFLFFVGLSVIAVIKNLYRNKIFGLLIIVIFARGFTDTIFLPGYFDFILLYLIIYPFNKKDIDTNTRKI